MKNNKYKIVALTDLQDTSDLIIENAVNMAKYIGANIKVFHVKKPADVVNSDSQLSALRTINKTTTVIDKKMKAQLEAYNEVDGPKIKRSFAIGNVRNEIESFIEDEQPDVVVIGKRRSSPLKIVGDGLTEFLLERYDGMVFISGGNQSFDGHGDLRLGAFNLSSGNFQSGIAKSLVDATQNEVKSFRVVDKIESKDKTETEESMSNVVEYVFEQNDTIVDSISNYVSKNKLNLLLVDRPTNVKSSKAMTKVKSLIKNSEVSMLFPGLRKFELN